MDYNLRSYISKKVLDDVELWRIPLCQTLLESLNISKEMSGIVH